LSNEDEVAAEEAQNQLAQVTEAKQTLRRSVAVSSDQQIALDRLIEVATPLISAYFENQQAMQHRELAFEEKVLEHDSRRQRNLTSSFAIIIASVLVFAGYLIAQGRDTVAIDLIKLLAMLGSVGFGGYGIARSRGRRDDSEE
jgi:hypothetical protein